MDSILLGICLGSCLKGEGSNIELYEALGFDNNHVSQEDIRQAFRKKTLQLHPDKLAQRGIQATQEDAAKFVKCKEAYEILSDPKRRKRYDQLGLVGLKLLENPREANPSDLIKNFKRNQGDRYKVAVLIGLVFCIILIFPIIFCLKADGTLHHAPWTAIWTPIWCIDFMLFVAACVLCTDKGEPNEDGSDNVDKVTPTVKIVNFLETVTFIMLQIFILVRLDKDVSWSWRATFSPWYIYECISVFSLIGPAFSTVREPQSMPPPSVEDGDIEEDPRLTAQVQYFEQLVTQISSKVQLVCSLLRLWQAVFLAVKLDNGSWNWGLVFLPIWLYFFFQMLVSRHYKAVAERMLLGLSKTDLQSQLAAGGEGMDPLDSVKYHQYEQLSATGTTVVCAQIAPLFMSIMLVCRLQYGTYSTFLIVLPVVSHPSQCCIDLYT